jgi:putative nucleotidyltransferase with HDIG domain
MEGLSKETILFVDDEESILDVASEFFQVKGYDVHIAQNGRRAIEILEQEKIDCCFTDINMPEMDGLELAERIRTCDNSIPVIVMTGYPSLDNTIRTLKNGVVDFLIKPVNLNQMEICLRRVLRERHLFVENILLKQEVESKERLEKLNHELLYKVEELNILNRIMREFAAIGTTADVFQHLIDMTVDVSHADESRFYVINEAVKRPFEVACTRSGVDGRSACPDGEATAGRRAMEQVIMDTVSDRIPLLITENCGAKGLSPDIRSCMVVPLTIREKVFGVLTASVHASANRFSEKDLYYLSFMTQNAAHAIENLALYENIYENLFATLYGFVKALESRDTYTQQHSDRVTQVAVAIAKVMGCSTEELDILNTGGRLHDIGKIGIRDSVLLKPGRLSEEEFETIKQHPVIGAEIVGHLGLWDREQQLIRHHHERWDGNGYPDKLKGEDIPKLCRILSIADAYDAMASNRPYRKKMPEEKVLSIIKGGGGSQFDPVMVDVFMDLYGQGTIRAVTEQVASSGALS